MPLRTTGRRVQCQADLCPKKGKVWIIRPEPYFEKGRLDSELHTWPNVFCSSCLNQPAFVGYHEEEVRTSTRYATGRRYVCDNEHCEKHDQIILVPMDPGGVQVCTCGQQSRFVGYEQEVREEPQ